MRFRGVSPEGNSAMIKIVYILAALSITLPITTTGYYSKKNLPGALLCLLIAIAAWFLGLLLPVAGGAVIAILLGMLLANLWKYPAIYKAGISATSKRILQTAIVLLGFQMNLSHVLTLGAQGLVLICATIITAVLLAYGLGKALRIQANEQVLIGIGTAICGGSAIAAVAPVIKAQEREIATAISTIFLFNVLAVFIFPLLGHIMSMSDLRFGMWCGAAINDTSSVVAAAYSYSDAAGQTATVVKLTRTLMIIPAAFILALYQAKKEGGPGNFHVLKVFPWFVAAFLIACILNSVKLIPQTISMFWGGMGKFCIMAAMAGIGLSTNVGELIRHGRKPLILGGCCSIAVAAMSIFIQALLGIM
ncbi:MAG: YeiH family protein [Clostridiales bacterium]|nr:YeiH family protein [Clostridiales bacterium]